MQTYVGYGFNVNDITDEQWLDLIEKYNEKDYINHLEINEALGSDKNEQTELALEWLFMNYMDRGDYLTDIINGEEGLELVVQYDDYVVFNSIDFLDHCKERALRIKNREDFIQLIAEYVPIDNIKFGNLYAGVAWTDPCYYLE